MGDQVICNVTVQGKRLRKDGGVVLRVVMLLERVVRVRDAHRLVICAASPMRVGAYRGEYLRGCRCSARAACIRPCETRRPRGGRVGPHLGFSRRPMAMHGTTRLHDGADRRVQTHEHAEEEP